jgi:striatin 1/3/4
MVAHQDAVATAAMHPDGGTVVTGGQDSSMRAWDVRTYACVQETPTHRPKYDEAVLGLAIHPTGALLASGGGDASLRVFL